MGTAGIFFSFVLGLSPRLPRLKCKGGRQIKSDKTGSLFQLSPCGQQPICLGWVVDRTRRYGEMGRVACSVFSQVLHVSRVSWERLLKFNGKKSWSRAWGWKCSSVQQLPQDTGSLLASWFVKRSDSKNNYDAPESCLSSTNRVLAYYLKFLPPTTSPLWQIIWLWIPSPGLAFTVCTLQLVCRNYGSKSIYYS